MQVGYYIPPADPAIEVPAENPEEAVYLSKKPGKSAYSLDNAHDLTQFQHISSLLQL